VRDGSLKASIWRIEAKNVFHTVSISKSFRDREGNWQERASFTQHELPRLLNLLRSAMEKIADLEGAAKGRATLDAIGRH